MGNCALERESVILWDCGKHFAAALKMTFDGFHQIRLNFNFVLLATSLKITRRNHLVVNSGCFTTLSSKKSPSFQILCF